MPCTPEKMKERGWDKRERERGREGKREEEKEGEEERVRRETQLQQYLALQ